MDVSDRFATRVKNLEAVPEPFRAAMSERLGSDESAHLLVFGPRYGSLEESLPTTLLAVTEQRWIIVFEDAGGTVRVDECGFDDTILVELTAIQLYGQLKIDFVVGGTARSSAIVFDVEMDKLYREATCLILDGIGSPSVQPRPHTEDSVLLESWLLKFYNAVPESLPQGQHLLAATHWPAVVGGFGRELAPTAALLATERELVLIAEELPRPHVWFRKQSKYGFIVTYVPLARLAGFHLSRHERFAVLDLEMHVTHGGEKLKILFPAENVEEVARVVQRVARSSS